MTIKEGQSSTISSPDRYNVRAVEEKWQKIWEEEHLYETKDSDKEKFYCLEQFPYPSGHLHMGHVRVYTLGDVIARYRRMAGYNVLHPMGWDAFGMPAENAAIKNGIPPRTSTMANIAYMKQQMKQMGLSFDWSREVTTSEPEYYRFTQELFLLFYERGLAYQKEGAVNWCPSCETVLANEQVEDGLCWRCDSVVTKRDLTQWYFRITDYAERLLTSLDALDWPQEIKTQQFNWIGKSIGAEVVFDVPSIGQKIAVFTTRPDTLYGATYVVLAPEHPLVEQLIANYPEADKVRQFIAEERVHSDIERTAENTEKRGIFTGSYAIHPLTGEKLPIWIANYVLVDYGTGAVMGVPAHDQRDFLYAQKYHLPMKVVVQPENPGEDFDQQAYTGPGKLVNSGPFTGFDNQEAKALIASALKEQGKGGPRVSYRMRDWLISRQRYWGAPIPIIHCPKCGAVPVPKDQLPVLLPTNVEFTGQGASPLAGAKDWLQTTCPVCQGPATRETDTMDTFVDSSWYYYRFTSPNAPRPFNKADVDYWMPVDEYVGGKEHAVLHLLYSRFFTKVLYDAGWVSVDEPFKRLLAQGMVVYGGAKMSKSKGNTLSPENIMKEWGSDATRVFMLFAAPPDKDFEWSQQGVEGAYRFLQRVYRLVMKQRPEYAGPSPEEAKTRVCKVVHRTVKKISEDIGERRAFNTAISALMELTNALYQDLDALNTEDQIRILGILVRLLAPFAPHLAEELWHQLGHDTSVHWASWPQYDDKWLQDEEVTIALQINGKVRSRLTVPVDMTPETLRELALADEKIQTLTEGRTIVKVIAVPGRLVNVVIR
ncbi:leucine--tRNA ligase [Sulfobacillus thermosulfidooxidans]|uniref:leucine--tRNA ligase n=1 Tax=Sulfobacillus thermosulfidooxidans TaxID=28034 RepID=UPI000406EDAF|nr:leucine--tRNA ligase [Sulfobacillus thermosulfidooxidans]